MQTNRVLALGFTAAAAAAALIHGNRPVDRIQPVPPVQDPPLTIHVASMTLANDASFTLDGKNYRCHQRTGCKAILPNGGYAIFLPADK